MKKNDVISLRAENLGAEMEGVCHHEGRVVFVPGLLPGEEAPIHITKVEKRFAFGRLESLPLQFSPVRQPVDCSAFPQCGGCTARHISYPATLEAKRQQIQDCFQRIGHLSVSIPPVLGMAHPLAYRNKTSLPVGGSVNEPRLGFFAPRSHRLIPAAHCPNAMPPTSGIALIIEQWMKDFHIPFYMEETGSGILRHVVIRVNRKHEAMVTLVSAAREIPHLPDLIHRLTELQVISIWLNINPKQTNVIFGDHFHHLYGTDTLTDTLCGLQFELSPSAFFQINPFQTEILYRTALEFAELKPTDHLCDVYCGAGTISLTMAGHCQTVTGIEVVPAAVENARENALRNNIRNASFYMGKAEEVLPQLVQDGLRPDVIVVDPPRKGLDPMVIDTIASVSPDRLVYVSCNPATLARDAALLDARGYHIEKTQPVDMFPYTSHVETCCLLSKQL